MTAILTDWNAEKITVIAPDPASAKAGKKLAQPGKWQRLGHDTASAWGEHQGSGSRPYQVLVDLLRLQNSDGAAYHCSCPSRKQPCKHTLGLLFLLIERPTAFPTGTAPEFVTAWLDKAAQRARRQQAKKQPGESKPVDPQQQAKTMAARQQAMMAGLQELELWLINLIRHGLGDPQLKTYAFWEAKAARMVDAQAPGLATWLRDLAGLPGSRSDWGEPLLDQLSRIYLLIQGFKRFDSLSPETQADLRAVLGWYQKREEVAAREAIHDRWLVTGRQLLDPEHRLRGQRLWLRGQASGRDALILEFAYGDTPFDTLLAPGTTVEADLIYFPGRYPLRAFISNKTSEAPATSEDFPPGTTIKTAIAAYAGALADNPWLRQFPCLLAAVIPTRLAGKWIGREVEGDYLPLAAGFDHTWALLALSGGHPLRLCGEWDGTGFLPTAALVDGRFVDFNQVGALP